MVVAKDMRFNKYLTLITIQLIDKPVSADDTVIIEVE